MGTNKNSRNETTKFGVHLLVVIFGITSWSIMNGLWVELPILVTYLPEGWTLPSYLTIVTQFGFLGLLAFSLISYLMPSAKLEVPASFVIVTALTLCALLYSFFWAETAYVAGGQYSVALLGLTFSQAAFAATTSIAYVTFMAHLKSRYMASIFIGMGLSGLIPALVAVGQTTDTIRCAHSTNLTVEESSNATQELTTLLWSSSDVGITVSSMNGTENGVRDWQLAPIKEPLFSIQAFFLLLFGMGVLSLLSLVMLVYHPYCRSEHVDTVAQENCQLMEVSRKPETRSSLTDNAEQQYSPRTLNNNTDTTVTENNNILMLKITDEKPTYNNTFTTSEIQFPMSEEPTEVISLNPVVYPHSFNQVGDRMDISCNTSLENTSGVPSLTSQDEAAIKSSNVNDRDDNVATNTIDDKFGSEAAEPDQGKQLSKLESWYLLGLLVWINALQSSFVLAIQVYSSLPYGIQFYHGATKAENIVDPLASFMTFWISANTTTTISGLALLGTLFTAYIVTVAAMSPTPFLVTEAAGGVLVVMAWVMCTMLMIFCKVSIAKIMRGQGRLSLMWTGGSTQLGALVGAILAYLLINHLRVFKDEPWSPKKVVNGKLDAAVAIVLMFLTAYVLLNITMSIKTHRKPGGTHILHASYIEV